MKDEPPLHVLVVALLRRAQQRRLAALGKRDELIAEFSHQGVEGAVRELRECGPTVH